MATDPPYEVNYEPEWRNEAGVSTTMRTGKVPNDDRADWRQAWALSEPGNPLLDLPTEIAGRHADERQHRRRGDRRDVAALDGLLPDVRAGEQPRLLRGVGRAQAVGADRAMVAGLGAAELRLHAADATRCRVDIDAKAGLQEGGAGVEREAQQLEPAKRGVRQGEQQVEAEKRVPPAAAGHADALAQHGDLGRRPDRLAGSRDDTLGHEHLRPPDVAAMGTGNANRGVAFVVQSTHAKEFALAHWLVGGADGGRVCVRPFDGAGTVQENQPQDVLASGTTMQWDTASKSRQAGAVMQDSSLNRRQTVRLGAGVAFAQIGIIGFDGQIELEALRLYGLPEDAPAILYGCPSLPAGTRTLALETSWERPSLGPGATANVDVTVPGARRGDFADASLDTSSISFVLDCHVWSNNSVRVTARNVSASTVDLAAAPLAVQVVKRRSS